MELNCSHRGRSGKENANLPLPNLSVFCHKKARKAQKETGL
jgi:hypothetical protein